jgi:hypothetical protein
MTRGLSGKQVYFRHQKKKKKRKKEKKAKSLILKSLTLIIPLAPRFFPPLCPTDMIFLLLGGGGAEERK